jgi:predicted O-methyltransferase YrrM
MATNRNLNGKQWEATSDLSSELETQEFLYGLVRVLKPMVSVETGCYRGEATLAMATALSENGLGKLYTCDIDHGMCDLVYSMVCDLPGHPAHVWKMDSVKMLSGIQDVDFAFIDGGSDRTAEMEALNLSSHAYVVLHDANNPDYKFPRKWSAEFGCKLNVLRFPTPLGLAVFEVKR